jgi:transcriptional regulator with XRE-family HTH domain
MEERKAMLTLEFTTPDRLRKAREHRELSQAEFAQITGLGRSAIQSYESGKTRPKRGALNLWALATGVSVQWLETGTAPDSNEPDAALSGLVRHQGLEPRTH